MKQPGTFATAQVPTESEQVKIAPKSDGDSPALPNPQNEKPLFRVLLVDDNQAIHNDYKKILQPRSNELDDLEASIFGETASKNLLPRLEIDSAYQGQEGAEFVRKATRAGRPYALAFVDVRMPPGWDGIETVRAMWEIDPDIQVVICTAFSDYSWSEMISGLGQTDRFVILKKPFDVIEIQQLAYSLTEKWQLGQQVKAYVHNLESLVARRTAELQQSLSLLNATLESTGDGILAVSSDGKIINYNKQFIQFWNLPPEIIGFNRCEAVMSYLAERLETPDAFLRQIKYFFEKPDASDFGSFKLKDGRHVELLSQPQKLGNEIIGRVFNFRDSTKKEILGEQLRQAQKMECVGQLAGGIAHDFNNLLTVIQGHAMLISGPDLDKMVNDSAAEIMASAEKAAALTRQLLTFSRRQVMQMTDIDLNDTVTTLSRMLRRIISENIEVKLDLTSELPPIRGDRGMIEQILMNLIVNSRDAMPGGGKITIHTASLTLKESFFGGEKIPAGNYVSLSVADTGCGIPPENLPHLFEPFFTTKPVGHGTGLGLATAYGAVKQHRGAIKVDSAAEKGTTFTILFPAAATKPKVVEAKAAQEKIQGGKETILLVDDDPAIRQIVRTSLGGYGYRVLEASSGLDALSVWRSRLEKIDLVLTDLVMTGGLNGQALVAKLREDAPNLKVIFTSGYGDVLSEKDAALKDAPNFISKPYHPTKLAQTVRTILDN